MSKITNDGSDWHRMLYSCTARMAAVGVKGLSLQLSSLSIALQTK